jgi:plastocyanin
MAVVVTAATIVSGAACSDDDAKDESASSPTASSETGAQSVTIQVDGEGEGFDAVMIAYFPDAVTLHPGDTARFTLADSGEPHTVSAGGPLDEIFDFVEGYCGPELFQNEEKCGDEVEAPPEIEEQFNALFEKFPGLFPDGPGDVNQGPANPCFLETGELALDTPCPTVDQPDFTGTQEFYSSGWLGADEDFVVKLADDIAPGTYRFMCLLHGPEMVEAITVVDAASDADTASEVDARREEQVGAIQDLLTQPAADLEAFAGSDESGAHIDVQVGAEAAAPALVAEFGSSEITIPVGGSVSWGDIGGHTVSFNASEEASTLRVVAADGTIHLNEAALKPAQVPEPPADEGEGAPPEGEGDEPPPEEGPPPVLDAGSWNGDGFLSTGFAEGIFKLTFSTAGTYEYKCLVHPGMEGTVIVGP